MRSPHSFDWHGFKFTLMLAVAVLFAGASAEKGTTAVLAYFSHPAPREEIVAHLVETPTSTAPTSPEMQVASVARTLRTPTIAEMIPEHGKFIGADLDSMQLYLYKDAELINTFPILTKGRPGTPWETPSGAYEVLNKERTHYSSIGKVYMDYSMQFFGNYFIHGWPYYEGGKPVASTYSGGCIRLSNDDAKTVFTFSDTHTPLYVYLADKTASVAHLAMIPAKVPEVSAQSYLVVDLDSGDVLAEKNAQKAYPIASVTKLMTALVANETISFDKKLPVKRGLIGRPRDERDHKLTALPIGELLYPLLMESSNMVADQLSAYYDQPSFLRTMNTAARAFNMLSTHYDDPTGLSKLNVSTGDDLARLASYLLHHKSFILGITRTPIKTLIAEDGSTFHIENLNKFSEDQNFIGGKIGFTDEAEETMVSIFETPTNNHRHIGIVVLRSTKNGEDTKALRDWAYSVIAPSAIGQTACAGCVAPPRHLTLPL